VNPVRPGKVCSYLSVDGLEGEGNRMGGGKGDAEADSSAGFGGCNEKEAKRSEVRKSVEKERVCGIMHREMDGLEGEKRR